MLRWVLIFLVIALCAGILGFGLVEGISLDIAKILFVVFLVLLVVGLLSRALGGPVGPPVP